MMLHWEPITLDLKTTFRIAHGASDQRFNGLVHLDDGAKLSLPEDAGQGVIRK